MKSMDIVKVRFFGAVLIACIAGSAQAVPVAFNFETTIGFDSSQGLGLGGATAGDLFNALFGDNIAPSGEAALSGSIVFESTTPATESNATTSSYNLPITSASVTGGATTAVANMGVVNANSDSGIFNFASSPNGFFCLGGTDAICPGLSKTANFVGVADSTSAFVEGTQGNVLVNDVDAITLRIGGTPATGEFSPTFFISGLGDVAVEYISIDLITTEGASIVLGDTALPTSSDVFTSDLLTNSIFRVGFSASETSESFEFSGAFTSVGPDDEPTSAIPVPPTVLLFATAGALAMRRRPHLR